MKGVIEMPFVSDSEKKDKKKPLPKVTPKSVAKPAERTHVLDATQLTDQLSKLRIDPRVDGYTSTDPRTRLDRKSAETLRQITAALIDIQATFEADDFNTITGTKSRKLVQKTQHAVIWILQQIKVIKPV
jgi:predicted lipoprotein